MKLPCFVTRINVAFCDLTIRAKTAVKKFVISRSSVRVRLSAGSLKKCKDSQKKPGSVTLPGVFFIEFVFVVRPRARPLASLLIVGQQVMKISFCVH